MRCCCPLSVGSIALGGAAHSHCRVSSLRGVVAGEILVLSRQVQRREASNERRGSMDRSWAVSIGWLSDVEEELWRGYLLSVGRVGRYVDGHVRHGTGMPRVNHDLLMLLSMAPQRRLRMSALASRAGIIRSRASQAVDQLENIGLVRREVHPYDRRGYIALLTDEGLTAVRASASAHATAIRRALLDVLTPAQWQQLHDITHTIATAVDELLTASPVHEPPPPKLHHADSRHINCPPEG